MSTQNHNQPDTKAMVESGVLTTIGIIIILITYYMPLFAIVGSFLWPIPITLIYVKYGFKYSIMSVISTLVISLMLINPFSAVWIVIIYGLMGLMLGYCIKNKIGAGGSILRLTGTVFIALLAMVQMFSVILGTDVIKYGIDMLLKGYETSINLYNSMGVSKELQTQMASMLPSEKLISSIIPALFLMYSVIAAFLCYWVTQKVLKRFRYEIPVMPPVSEWYIPSKASFLIIIIFGGSFFLMYSGIENGERYFMNAYLIFVYGFSVNAVAFLSWFLKKRNMGKVLRVVVILLCILPPIATYLYLVGVFDYIFDFRKLDPIRKRIKK